MTWKHSEPTKIHENKSDVDTVAPIRLWAHKKKECHSNAFEKHIIMFSIYFKERKKYFDTFY